MNSNGSIQLSESTDIDEMKSQLFANNFFFQILYKPRGERFSWVFDLYTFAIDFYLSPTQIKCLEQSAASFTILYI